MAHTRADVGRNGEELAAEHLQRAGYTILERNWRCADGGLRGEVDIVALDGGTLVVCEVKSRRRGGVDDALEGVTGRKQGRLRRLAGAYVAALDWRPAAVRIDVIGVCWPASGGPAQIVHLREVC